MLLSACSYTDILDADNKDREGMAEGRICKFKKTERKKEKQTKLVLLKINSLSSPI